MHIGINRPSKLSTLLKKNFRTRNEKNLLWGSGDGTVRKFVFLVEEHVTEQFLRKRNKFSEFIVKRLKISYISLAYIKSSSIPPCVTIKTPLVRKGTGNQFIKIHFPRKRLRALSLVSATLEIEYATQFCM